MTKSFNSVSLQFFHVTVLFIAFAVYLVTAINSKE